MKFNTESVQYLNDILDKSYDELVKKNRQKY